MDQTTSHPLWHELATGNLSIVDHDRARVLLVREDTREGSNPRAFTERERQVVEHASFGHSNKVIAYELGIAPSTVATHLSNAAAKLGLQSRAALILVYAALAHARSSHVVVSTTQEPGARRVVLSLPLGLRIPTTLSPAERDVVARIFAGESNAAIARARGASVRTVANQVARVMKKLRVGSRAAIIAHLTRPDR